MPDPVADYYDSNPKSEWNRLVSSPYRRLEFEIAMHHLLNHLPDSGAILDVGGGPGRYTIALARQGYRMTLVDCSKKVIALAQQKFSDHGVENRIDGIHTGDARDLSFLPDRSFDAVLAMGPLYHLQQERDRLACLAECHRLLKPSGNLFVTMIPRWSYIRDALRSQSFAHLLNESPSLFETILEQGYSQHDKQPNMYYTTLDDIQTLIDRSGFQLTGLCSLHGMASFFVEQVNEIAKDSEHWSHLVQLAIRSSGDPHALAAAEYLFCIAQKTS